MCGGTGRGVGNLYSGKKGKLQCAPSGGCWLGEAGGGLTRNGVSYTIDQRCIFIWLSLAGPKLNLGTKIREAVSHQSTPGHLGPIMIGVIV